MKGKTDRENDAKSGKRIVYPKCVGERCERVVKEIEILEDEKNEARRDDADEEYLLAYLPFRALYPHTGEVIDEDRDKQDKDIDRDEPHVEGAARNEQHERPIPLRQEEVEDRNDRKEDEEFERIEEHASPLRAFRELCVLCVKCILFHAKIAKKTQRSPSTSIEHQELSRFVKLLRLFRQLLITRKDRVPCRRRLLPSAVDE